MKYKRDILYQSISIREYWLQRILNLDSARMHHRRVANQQNFFSASVSRQTLSRCSLDFSVLFVGYIASFPRTLEFRCGMQITRVRHLGRASIYQEQPKHVVTKRQMPTRIRDLAESQNLDRQTYRHTDRHGTRAKAKRFRRVNLGQ